MLLRAPLGLDGESLEVEKGREQVECDAAESG